MRKLILLLALVGCGEASSANVVDVDGAAGATGSAGTTGAAGTGGDQGAAGTTGAAGTGATVSCNLTPDQLNGTDVAAMFDRGGSCADSTVRVEIVGGVTGSVPYATEWVLKSMTAEPSFTPGYCAVSLRYERQDATCGTDRLFVRIGVPGN